MKPLQIVGQVVAWTVLLTASAAHYILSLISKGMGYTLPLEQVVSMQITFGLISLLIAGLFRASGWRLWQALCLTLGTQAVVVGHIIVAFRPEDASPLEWSVAIACQIGGAAAICAVGASAVFRQVRITQG